MVEGHRVLSSIIIKLIKDVLLIIVDLIKDIVDF